MSGWRSFTTDLLGWRVTKVRHSILLARSVCGYWKMFALTWNLRLVFFLTIMKQDLVSSTTLDCEPIGEFHSVRRVTKVRHLISLACNAVCGHWKLFFTNLAPASDTFDYHCIIFVILHHSLGLGATLQSVIHEFHLGKWCCLTWPYHQGAVNTDRQWSTS